MTNQQQIKYLGFGIYKHVDRPNEPFPAGQTIAVYGAGHSLMPDPRAFAGLFTYVYPRSESWWLGGFVSLADIRLHEKDEFVYYVNLSFYDDKGGSYEEDIFGAGEVTCCHIPCPHGQGLTPPWPVDVRAALGVHHAPGFGFFFPLDR